nr:myosin-binding protein 7 isoform X1 [Solanum lycopersicum]XP_025883901.1 myosin-binding protein 7 isoform X1 [Solanum lycopersicum]XP_025883902.1 myosin-binding protein 7 isoform X1 [Solanum lycopersicum]XP_025883903.1 myosin-binding protein 7 isoform X1 [Solanum lycopersicum]
MLRFHLRFSKIWWKCWKSRKFANRGVCKLRKVDESSEVGDEMSVKVYTIDSIHQGAGYNGNSETKGLVHTPRDSLNHTDFGDPQVTKLYLRLQALDADRESMRQAIISMRTDKAQLILLKEIAQQWCKEASPERRTPVRKTSVVKSFSFISIFKVLVWVDSQQGGLAYVVRQGTSCWAMEMSFKYASVKPTLFGPHRLPHLLCSSA